jgi:hypothetical protein
VTTLTNSFEGITPSGTAISNANSGGTSGNALDAAPVSGGTTISSSSAQSAHGSLSAALAFPSGVNATGDMDWTTSMGSQAQVWFRMYLYHTANPTVNVRVWSCDGSGLNGALYLLTTGHLEFDNAVGGAAASSANAVPLSAWYRVEGTVLVNGTTGLLEFKIFTSMDSTTPSEAPNSGNTNTGTSNPTSYRFGNFAGGTLTSAWTIFYDDIGLSSTGYIGPFGSISGPNAASSGTDLGGGTGSWTSPGNITADDGSAATWQVV